MARQSIWIDPSLCAQVRSHISSLPSRAIHEDLGSGRVVVLSAHGFAHVRPGGSKPADSGSLETSLLIARASGSHWLATGRDGEPDANHHRDTPLKDALRRLIEREPIVMAIDIHTSHALRPFDVDVGTLSGSSWLGNTGLGEELLSRLGEVGLFATDNAVFKAEGALPDSETLTSFCASLGVPCAQLEISSPICMGEPGRAGQHLRAKLANAVADFIDHAQRQLLAPTR